MKKNTDVARVRISTSVTVRDVYLACRENNPRKADGYIFFFGSRSKIRFFLASEMVDGKTVDNFVDRRPVDVPGLRNVLTRDRRDYSSVIPVVVY